MTELATQGLGIGLTLLLTLLGWLLGRHVERQHFASLRERELEFLRFPVSTLGPAPELKVASARLVGGSVVVSLDYYKRFVTSFKQIFGGRLRAYEPLMERARREALLRMLDEAVMGGFDTVVGVRLETSRLASSAGNNKGTAGVEVLAYGTALKVEPQRGGEQGVG